MRSFFICPYLFFVVNVCSDLTKYEMRKLIRWDSVFTWNYIFRAFQTELGRFSMVSAPEETSRGGNQGSGGPPEMSQSVTLEFQGKANLVRIFHETHFGKEP